MHLCQKITCSSFWCSLFSLSWQSRKPLHASYVTVTCISSLIYMEHYMSSKCDLHFVFGNVQQLLMINLLLFWQCRKPWKLSSSSWPSSSSFICSPCRQVSSVEVTTVTTTTGRPPRAAPPPTEHLLPMLSNLTNSAEPSSSPCFL